MKKLLSKNQDWRFANKHLTQTKTINNFIEEIKELLGDYNTEREVWIATAGLSKKALKKEIEKDTGVDQAEEFHQLMWFFQNIEDTFSGIGVKLKIFCKE